MKQVTHTQNINYFLELYNIWPDSNIPENKAKVVLKQDFKVQRRNLPKQYQKHEPTTLTIPAFPTDHDEHILMHAITSFSDIGVIIPWGYSSYFMPWANVKQLCYETEK